MRGAHIENTEPVCLGDLVKELPRIGLDPADRPLALRFSQRDDADHDRGRGDRRAGGIAEAWIVRDPPKHGVGIEEDPLTFPSPVEYSSFNGASKSSATVIESLRLPGSRARFRATGTSRAATGDDDLLAGLDLLDEAREARLRFVDADRAHRVMMRDRASVVDDVCRSTFRRAKL